MEVQMAARIVIQDHQTKKKIVYDYETLSESGKDEKDISFDPETQKKFYEAYAGKRSRKDPRIRSQKKIKCKSLIEARKVEKKLIQLVTEEIAAEEAKGNTWGDIIDHWEFEAKRDYDESGVCRNPLNGKIITHKTVHNNVAMLKEYTKDWLKTPASELTRVHGKAVMRAAEEVYESYGSVKRLRGVIYSTYNFGMEEEIIKGVKKTPVCGVAIDFKEEDSLPEILTQKEVKHLLTEAKKRNHSWYPIWAVALATGMRSSELYALRKENVLLKEGMIRICEGWDWELDEAKSTKAGYWRNAPIAKSLMPMIAKLLDNNSEEYLFPRFYQWERGEQAKVLRSFCEQIGITSVRFHTLRACFATHLLASGVDQATVMRIGGWKTFKTFEVYVRLAGVREAGATDGMMDNLLGNNDEAIFEHASEILHDEAT
jgi:integrase